MLLSGYAHTPGGRELSEVERKHSDADTNPASAYELGRHDGTVVEREAIAEMLESKARECVERRYRKVATSFNEGLHHEAKALRQAAKLVRERK